MSPNEDVVNRMTSPSDGTDLVAIVDGVVTVDIGRTNKRLCIGFFDLRFE
jgi:hypothetical protein